MITTVSATKQDSGRTVHLTVGDILEVSLAEHEPTAAWKAEIDEDILGLVSQSAGESVWLLGETEQRTVRQFRAKKEGHAALKMSYQRLGETGITTLDTFTLDVTVGNPPVEVVERERVPLPEMALILIEILLFAAAFVYVAFTLAVYAGQPEPLQSMTKVMVGLTGTVLAGAVGVFCLLRLVGTIINRYWRRE